MAVREFECTLCQQPFRLLAGDFIVSEPNVCDDCLRRVWEMEREALEEHVAECLAGRETFPAGKIVEHIDWHQQEWAGADEAIEHRERERGAFG